MKVMWDCSNEMNTPPRTYVSYDNAVKSAKNILGDKGIRVLICATPEGRFFPVAVGEDAVSMGLHFHMCVTR